ncbi:DAK2 domain-containing protein, partial [Acinetobacter baumannii]
MFDAFSPAIATLERETADGVAFPTGPRKAFEAAERGRDETAALVARKGRASYLGQRSTNHVDPGAASTALLFRALAEVVA